MFTIPTPAPADTVRTFGTRVVEAATAHVMAHAAYTVANYADVSTSTYEGVQGPSLTWVRSVIRSACESINYADAWGNLSIANPDDTFGGTEDDVDMWDVLTELADAVQDADTYTDGWSEVADNAVPVYTHPRMVLFVDTLAYREDVSELGCESSDLETLAGVALYMQAERIARATATEVAAVIRSAINN